MLLFLLETASNRSQPFPEVLTPRLELSILTISGLSDLHNVSLSIRDHHGQPFACLLSLECKLTISQEASLNLHFNLSSNGKFHERICFIDLAEVDHLH
jgi:hypothetical protein